MKLCIGPYKTVGQSQELSHEAESLVMHAVFEGRLAEGLGGWQHRGNVVPSWRSKDNKQLAFSGVIFRSLSLSGCPSG